MPNMRETAITLDTVRVDKKELIDKLQKNRKQHAKDYEETLAEWKKAVAFALKKASKELKESGNTNLQELFNLNKPQSHVSEYDNTIDMLNWEQDDTVELDSREFNNYIQDEWSWRSGWEGTKSSLSAYSTSNKLG
jgi:hypothetical protein